MLFQIRAWYENALTPPRLYGPLPLTAESIDKQIQAKSPGVYELGTVHKGIFVGKEVGRSDEDLRSALKAHFGGPYKQFRFRYAMSARDAFEKECHLYHSLPILDQPHPQPPGGTDYKCPGCHYGVQRSGA